MIQSAEQFSRGEVLPRSSELEAQAEGLMPALIAKAGQLGFCGVDAPEAYGGLGLGKALSARILEFLSLDPSFSVTIGVTSGISQVGLSLFGSEDQRARYLTMLASGEWIGAYALSEPNSGTDALAMSTRAIKTAGGWTLEGTKMWISNAKWARLFVVFAKTDEDRVGAFLVERETDGLSISREEHKLGLKGSSTARLILDGVRVPDENLLHKADKGHQIAFNSLNIGRYKLSAMCLGPARMAVELAAKYAKERRQFGRPIAEFGLIRQKFALMAARFFAAESALYRTGGLLDEQFACSDGSIEENLRAASEFAVEASICKVLASEAQGYICDEALQVFGGYGFTEEFGIAKLYRDARVSRIYEGSNEINRYMIGERILRKVEAGERFPALVQGHWIEQLLGQALERGPQRCNQVWTGAVADLAMLVYAMQSVRARAARGNPTHQLLSEVFEAWAAPRAAEAYQTLTGEPVTLPRIHKAQVDDLAAAVLETLAPL